MTEDKAVYKAQSGLPAQIGEVGVVNWQAYREKLAPQGTPIKTKDLVGREFIIMRMRPYQSQFQGKRETVYWCVVVTGDGEVFNTTIGGEATAEVLDMLSKLQKDYEEAASMGDQHALRELEERGAGKYWRFTLQWAETAAGQGYYFFE